MQRRPALPIDSQALAPTKGFHAVRFYKDSSSLCRLAADFVGKGLAQGQPAVVISTPEHQQGIVQCLDAQAFDVEQLRRAGDLVLLDAQATLDQFMVDGMPDPTRFADTLEPVLERVSRGRQAVIRAYGEMVDVLWKAHQTVAATRLEMLWNDLARSHSFSLLCGYAMGNFYKDAAVEEICSHHTHVLAADGVAAFAG